MADTPQAVIELFAPPSYERRRVIRWALIVASTLLFAFLLLQNPYWVPGGDSDFYVAIARTLARGGHYEYNGLPVAISPPGWPWVMARVMRVTPTFMALKLTAMFGMWLSLIISYFIALRFVRPATAGVATILCGLLIPVYSLTYFLHSEGLYCLTSALALLLAFRLRERTGGWATRVALLLLCVAIPLIRWAGVFQLLPIVAVLLSGPRGLSWASRYWKTAVACSLVITATWLVTRHALQLTAAEQQAIKIAGGSSETESDVDEELPPEANTVPIATPSNDQNRTLVEEYGQRFLRSGKWFAWLLWQPTRFASVSNAADLLITIGGWGVIGMLGTLAYLQAKRGEWLWLSLAVYCGGLCMLWPNPNARYFVPVAPLIVLGLFLVISMLREAYPAVAFDGWKWARRVIIYSILLCNLAMYGVDVIVMRSSHFYDTFEAGQHKDLVNIAHYVMSLDPPPAGAATMPVIGQYRPEDGDVVLNERYENINRVRYSNAGLRAMVLLTDRSIKPLTHNALTHQLAPPFIPRLGKEMQRVHAEWLLIQAPSVPWRVWHFRLPQSLYQRLAKNTNKPDSFGWTLYHFDILLRRPAPGTNPTASTAPVERGTFTQQPVPSVDDWPRRVPGM